MALAVRVAPKTARDAPRMAKNERFIGMSFRTQIETVGRVRRERWVARSSRDGAQPRFIGINRSIDLFADVRSGSPSCLFSSRQLVSLIHLNLGAEPASHRGWASCRVSI